MRQGQTGNSIQLDARFLVGGKRGHGVGLRLRQVALCGQNQSGRGSAESVLFLFGFQRLLGKSLSFTGCFHLGPILLHRKLRVAHLDDDLVLEFLQQHLRLPIFEL